MIKEERKPSKNPGGRGCLGEKHLLPAASPLFSFLASWSAWLPDLKPYLRLSIASRKSPTSFLEAQNDIATSFPPDGFVTHLISSKYGHVTIVLHGSKLKKTAQFPLLPPCPLPAPAGQVAKKSMKSFCELHN